MYTTQGVLISSTTGHVSNFRVGRWWLFATMLGVLSSCATMNEGQCVSANWYDVGYEDGRQGKSIRSVSNYVNDCSEYGLNVDHTAYEDGWHDGIPSFCTADNGYQVGRNGGFYDNACPTGLKDRFYVAYLLGTSVHEARLRVDELRDEIEELGDKAARSGISDDRRKQLRRDRKKRKDDLEDAELDLFAAELRASENGF